MAIVKHNSLLEGLSGKLGGTLIFRTLRGKTVVSVMPDKGAYKSRSDAQRQTRSNFQEASAFAKACMKCEEKKSHYRMKAKQLNLPNAYTAALKEYLQLKNAKPEQLTLHPR